jgi:multidrug resistance efflux pump
VGRCNRIPAAGQTTLAQRPRGTLRYRREVDRIEAEIEGKEREVAELERRLAQDWANVDTAAAYRRTRDELDVLLARWEELFGQTPAV